MHQICSSHFQTLHHYGLIKEVHNSLGHKDIFSIWICLLLWAWWPRYIWMCYECQICQMQKIHMLLPTIPMIGGLFHKIQIDTIIMPHLNLEAMTSSSKPSVLWLCIQSGICCDLSIHPLLHPSISLVTCIPNWFQLYTPRYKLYILYRLSISLHFPSISSIVTTIPREHTLGDIGVHNRYFLKKWRAFYGSKSKYSKVRLMQNAKMKTPILVLFAPCNYMCCI